MRTLIHRFRHSHSTRGQAARFLVVGVSAMLVDLLTYRSVLYLTGVVSVGKSAGFIFGTTFAFFANRAFTFRDDSRGHKQILAFLSVYAVTLFVNVGVNALGLMVLGLSEIGLDLSFVAATICSATLNFFGLKRFVFAAAHL